MKNFCILVLSSILLYANNYSHLKYQVVGDNPLFIGSNVDDALTPDLFIMKEIWKPIKGYEGIYEISTEGKVKALDCKKLRGRFLQNRGEYLLKPKLNQDGYFAVVLQKDKSLKHTTIHRLVALHFVDNPLNKPMINHKDGIKTNNNAGNLEWCTNQENMTHAVATGLINNKGENGYLAKLKNEQVVFIRNSRLPLKQLAEMFGVYHSTIQKIRYGLTWKNLL